MNHRIKLLNKEEPPFSHLQNGAFVVLVLEVRPIWRLETGRDTQSGLTNVRQVKET